MHYSEVEKHIFLSLTENCNLNCSYCFEKETRSTEHMDSQTAIEIVEKELLKPSDYPFLKIDLFGGEPFLEFDTFRTICEHTWSKSWNRNYMIYTTTNGTLVHGEIKEWLSKNAYRIQCSLSLDGPKLVQDINRSHSFNEIDYKFFADTWPDCYVRAVIFGNTVSKTYDSIRFLHANFKKVNARVAFGFDWTRSNYVDVFREQVYRLIDFYLEHPEIEPATLLNVKIVDAAFPDKAFFAYCGAGKCVASYSVEGDEYPCPQFKAICKQRNITMHKLVDLQSVDAENLLEEKCKKCICKNICPTCMAGYFQPPKSIKNMSLTECNIFKIQAYATAVVKEAKLIKKYGSLDAEMSEIDKITSRAVANIKEAYENNSWYVVG